MIEAIDSFNQLASGPVRPLDWRVAISFTKARNSEISWFTLNQSMLGGPDLLAEDTDSPIQDWDAYDYQDVTERLIDMNISRSIEFPYNVQSAIADWSLDNHDGYLSIEGAGGSSPLSEYIIPKRPTRLYLGFKTAGVLPQFVGLTQGVPSYDGLRNERVSFTAMDFLSEIGDMKLTNMVMMRDVRTDEVLAEIFRQVGLRDSMFSLAEGSNVIPFVYFESGKSAGNALRELIQAENGALWLDEKGIIRFQPRAKDMGTPPVLILNEDNIVDIHPSRTDNIINSITITAEIRRIAALQPVFTTDNSYGYQSAAADDHYRVPANGTAEFWLNFDDPVWTVNNLVLDGPQTNSNFTAVNLNGEEVTDNITVEGTLFATSYKLTVVNANAHPISLYSIQLWGQPAKMMGDQPIEYQAQDEDSVRKYGTMEMQVTDNKCFGSVENARQYAEDVLREYSEYSNVLELEVKGTPALQLQDYVTVNYPGYRGHYIVKGITHKLSDAKLETSLTLRKASVDMPFTLDASLLDGPDLLI